MKYYQCGCCTCCGKQCMQYPRCERGSIDYPNQNCNVTNQYGGSGGIGTHNYPHRHHWNLSDDNVWRCTMCPAYSTRLTP